MDTMIKETNQAKSKSKKGREKRVLFTIAMVLIALAIAPFLFRAIYRAILLRSHAISEPGIDLMETVEIGGIQQCLYFRGQDVDNPVILFLHGGPGSPEMEMLHTFQYDWEEDFTVVHWDQRQVGKTYLANDPELVAETMSFNRVLEDAWEVTQYIQNKLGKDKIVVLGHSWGSVLGTALVQTHPESFSAYIGVGQVINMVDNERVGFEKTLDKAKEAGNDKDVAALEALMPYPADEYSTDVYQTIIKVRGYQMKYGLATGMNLESVISAGLSPYYSLNELRTFLIDHGTIQHELMKYLFAYDAHDFGIEYEMPVFYVIGENDYQTPIILSEAFFGEINAPVKQFFTIPRAGHMTMTDNKTEFTRVLLEEIAPLIK
ncbi:alpha/beta hydrolase [Lachnospiraceae bacterium ZAX-1]